MALKNRSDFPRAAASAVNLAVILDFQERFFHE